MLFVYCSINGKRQSKLSGLRPDTSSLVFLTVDQFTGTFSLENTICLSLIFSVGTLILRAHKFVFTNID